MREWRSFSSTSTYKNGKESLKMIIKCMNSMSIKSVVFLFIFQFVYIGSAAWADYPTQSERFKGMGATFKKAKKNSEKDKSTSDEVKQNCLKALFGVTTSKFWGITYENAIISRTSSLDIEQAKLLIDSLIWFGKQLKIENMVTSREMIHLFNTN